MTTTTRTSTCAAFHPYFEVGCRRKVHKAGKHVSVHHGRGVQWDDPTVLVNYGEISARKADPGSSHQAAARGFGVPGGVKGLKRDILTNVGIGWMTCREIVEAVFGSGPYTYDEAVGLNKIQTVCLKLYREGFLDRQEINEEPLRYRRKR